MAMAMAMMTNEHFDPQPERRVFVRALDELDYNRTRRALASAEAAEAAEAAGEELRLAHRSKLGLELSQITARLLRQLADAGLDTDASRSS
jgi:hypothetical protein